MKNGFALFSVLGLLLFSGVACKKKSDTVISPGSQSMSATINGIAFSTSGSNINETTQSSGGYYPTYSYNFTASQGSTSLSIDIPSASMGTYNFGVINYSPSLQYNSSDGKAYFTKKGGVPTKGNIIITSNASNTIGGTFTGTLFNSNSITDSVVITNGQFSNLVYQ